MLIFNKRDNFEARCFLVNVRQDFTKINKVQSANGEPFDIGKDNHYSFQITSIALRYVNRLLIFDSHESG